MSHTPGPWMVVVKPFGKGVKRSVHTDRDRPLGVYGASVAEVRGDPRSAAENDANARLIAAAPDLLNAAEMLAKAFDSRSLADARAAANAAIAKARGAS